MPQSKLAHGVIVPMVTPFTNDGIIDIEAIEKIIEFLIAAGTAPFIMGTTGESASIPEKARPAFVKTVVEIVSGRVKTYAGVSSPCFQTSVEAANYYFELGVDAVVAHPPSYYPLTDNQLLRYYESLANNISGPLILYNNPTVAHCSIPISVLDQLSHHARIIGVKDSEHDIQRLNQSLKLWSERDDFCHLLGWGGQMANGLLGGSAGLVPSSGNLVPKMHCEMVEAAQSGDLQKLEHLQKRTNDILDVYLKHRSLGQSLPALKFMMNALNLCEPYVLPPLETPNDDEKNQILKQMQSLNIEN
jgi:dihydrodipicolinate synthase/N-acetylneuraminate lyase